MPNLSQFGGGVKSVQRGTISLTSGTSGTATITAVDMNKAVVLHGGQRGGATDAASFFCTLVLTNTTTVTAARSASTTSADIPWQVIEYY